MIDEDIRGLCYVSTIEQIALNNKCYASLFVSIVSSYVPDRC